MTDATLTPAAGVGVASIVDRGILGIPRSLYLYENVGMQGLAIVARTLYLYENVGLQAIAVVARSLYLYEDISIQAIVVLARSLYLYETTRDLPEVFPWLMKIDPTEQYPGGTVDLYGDGFGEVREIATEATVTTSSVSGSNVGGQAIDRTSAEWVSTSGASAWIRLTFAGPRKITGIALSDRAAGTVETWGTPEFRFSDGGPNVIGAGPPPQATPTTEVPVGASRAYYALPAIRTTTYVEVRIVAGTGGFTNRGLSEVWVYEDDDEDAEGSSAILNDGLVNETGLGTVVWSGRSPGLWPANGGLPIEPAATVTVPADAESGLVVVEETL